MTVNQRPQWTAVEIAAHAMEATSLSQLTLPEVKRMAAYIISDHKDASEPGPADPASALNEAMGNAMHDNLAKL